MKVRAAGPVDTTYVGVLDGVRTLGVLAVVWFHFWQQTWLHPVVKLPFTGWLLGFEWLPRSGYIMVDLLLVLSGFCLFLPIARQMARGEADAGHFDVRAFYRRRAARILPSYYFCVLLILFAVVLPAWPYTNAAEFWRDLLASLTMTQTFFAETFFFTKFNVVLWTVCIEVQFYLLFPLLARAFARRPVASAALMTGVSALGAALLLAGVGDLRFWLNQLPLLLCNYAAGMLGAVAFVRLAAVAGGKPAAMWGFSALAHRLHLGHIAPCTAAGSGTGVTKQPAAAAFPAQRIVWLPAGGTAACRQTVAGAVRQQGHALFGGYFVQFIHLAPVPCSIAEKAASAGVER